MRECAVPRESCVACVNVSFSDNRRQCVQPHFGSVGNSKFSEGPSREFDGIESDLNDATIRLWVWTSTLSSPLQSCIVTPHECIVKWASPLGWACSFGLCVSRATFHQTSMKKMKPRAANVKSSAQNHSGGCESLVWPHGRCFLLWYFLDSLAWGTLTKFKQDKQSQVCSTSVCSDAWPCPFHTWCLLSDQPDGEPQRDDRCASERQDFVMVVTFLKNFAGA